MDRIEVCPICSSDMRYNLAMNSCTCIDLNCQGCIPYSDLHLDMSFFQDMFDINSALLGEGYLSIRQIVSYFVSEDPTYITAKQNARSKIMKYDRYDAMGVLIALNFFLMGHISLKAFYNAQDSINPVKEQVYNSDIWDGFTKHYKIVPIRDWENVSNE